MSKATAGDSASLFKTQIRKLVADYKRNHLNEYVLVVHAIRTKAAQLTDSRFGTANTSGNEMRALFELPETLNNNIIRGLGDEGLKWFATKPAAHWFCKTYPEFQLPDQL